MEDVVVIGAGPAGAVVARQLGRAGIEPVLLERADAFPRPRACAGVVPRRFITCLERVGLRLPAGVVTEDRIEHLRITVPGGGSLVSGGGGDGMLVLDRPGLDQALVQEAVRAGARLHLGWRVEGLEAVDGGGWRVLGRRGAFEARVVVLANGPRDGLASAVRRPAPVLGLGAELEVASPGKGGELVVEVGALPGGFFWMLPCGDRLRLGYISTATRVPGVRRILNAFLGRHGLADVGVLRSLRSAIPEFRPDLPVRAGLVQVGDQAGAVDPLSGLGLEGAIRTALWAAESVQRALASGRFSLSDYAARYRRELERDFGMARRIASALHARPERFIELLKQRPARGVELGRCLTGSRRYRTLTRGLVPTLFDRFLRATVAGSA